MFHKRGQRYIVFEATDVPAPPDEEIVAAPAPSKAHSKTSAAGKKKVLKVKAGLEEIPTWEDLCAEVTAQVASIKEQKLQELAAAVQDEKPVEETPNHLAAMLMVQHLDSLPGSPWIITDTTGEHDLLAQLIYALQNPALDLHGPGFVIHLDNHGHRLKFTKAWPKVANDYPLEDRTHIFGPGAKHYGQRSIVDLTYWNVENSWAGQLRSLTIPVCRFSGFRGPTILGTGVKSVRRSLISVSHFCPCHAPFHITARGDDGRTLQGVDLVQLYPTGPGPAKYQLDGGPSSAQWHFDGQPVDPFPKD